MDLGFVACFEPRFLSYVTALLVHVYIYVCIRIYISGSVAVLGGAERSLKRSVLYRTPEQGYWITVIFNYESTRILAKTGAKPERERGGEKKGKNRKTIDERFNRGLPSSRNRVDFKRMHFSRGLAFIKICIEAQASQGRDEIPFCGRNEIENDEFFLEKGARKGRKRKEREKKKGKYRFSSLRELGRWGKNDEETGGN